MADLVRLGRGRRPLTYLDHNATTPLDAGVWEAMGAVATGVCGNPASVHAAGRRARAIVDEACEIVGAAFGCAGRDVVLTSGGTEANNLALAHAFPAGAPGALALSRLEHPSVLRFAERLEASGVHLAWIVPTATGHLAPEALGAALDAVPAGVPVRLCALHAVHHETGVVQPVPELAAVARARGIPLHVDVVQALGKVPAAAWAGGDLYAVGAHKCGGPKGIGALVHREGVRLRPILVGGSQQRGLRPGTEDPVLATGLRATFERLPAALAAFGAASALRDAFEARVLEAGRAHGVEGAVNGGEPRAPHVTNLSFRGWSGPELCAALDLEGVAVSSGSACSAGTAEPSSGLVAFVGADRARCAVRVSFGEASTDEDLQRALEAWDQVLRRTPV